MKLQISIFLLYEHKYFHRLFAEINVKQKARSISRILIIGRFIACWNIVLNHDGLKVEVIVVFVIEDVVQLFVCDLHGELFSFIRITSHQGINGVHANIVKSANVFLNFSIKL